jgi:hypothetical protein
MDIQFILHGLISILILDVLHCQGLLRKFIQIYVYSVLS